MGYNLIANNKDLPEFNPGLFTWPIMLQETGMGYVLGYGSGRAPATYVYQNGNNGSPVSNDGYKVSSRESKMMAHVGNGYLAVQRFVNKDWEKMDPEERARAEEYDKDRKPIYRHHVSEDWLKKIEAFCEWAEKSQGFKIK